MLPAPLISFETVGFPEYVTLPAPEIDTFKTSVAFTEALPAPLIDNSIARVTSDSASSLLAPFSSPDIAFTLPVSVAFVAPFASR